MSTLPSLPLPPPYLCSAPGSFAENTLVVRLPEIARRIPLENQFPESANRRIAALIADLPDGQIRPLADPHAPDGGLWQDYLEPFLGLPWRQLSFLECENIFYRRVLEATGYFEPGPTQAADPFSAQKTLGLQSALPAIHALAARLAAWAGPDLDPARALAEAIETNLWGNRADLSLWPAGAETTPASTQLHQAAEFLLASDLDRAVQTILNFQPGRRRVDFLIDNAGYELVCDLALADLLLRRGLAEQVQFHLKAHPTFVSDALPADVRATIAFLAREADPQTAGFAARMAAALAEGRLLLSPNYFLNSPLPGWKMPAPFRQTLAEAALVISKGDMNYRRLAGDLRWPAETPFAEVLSYFPTRLLALRTPKSEVILGLRPGQTAQLDPLDPSWRTNGRWGLIQLK